MSDFLQGTEGKVDYLVIARSPHLGVVLGIKGVLLPIDRGYLVGARLRSVADPTLDVTPLPASYVAAWPNVIFNREDAVRASALFGAAFPYPETARSPAAQVQAIRETLRSDHYEPFFRASLKSMILEDRRVESDDAVLRWLRMQHEALLDTLAPEPVQDSEGGTVIPFPGPKTLQ